MRHDAVTIEVRDLESGGPRARRGPRAGGVRPEFDFFAVVLVIKILYILGCHFSGVACGEPADVYMWHFMVTLKYFTTLRAT